MTAPPAGESPATHAADRLLAAVQRIAAPACVGIDPVVDRLPQMLRPKTGDPAESVEAMGAFVVRLLDAIAPHVPCVKFQSACFERHRELGVAALSLLIGEARLRGLEVILDAKRGDIGLTAEHYAAAAFDPGPYQSGESAAHWLTVNSYLGPDAIRPLLAEGCGVFALVRTSNPGSDAVQSLPLEDGRTVAEAVADMLADLGAGHVGSSGYSAVGAVVAATKGDDAAALRARMPRQIFLVPGFGAQGGGAEDVRPCFADDGRGAIVTASRSIIYAFDPADAQWAATVADAAKRFADDLGRAAGLR